MREKSILGIILIAVILILNLSLTQIVKAEPAPDTTITENVTRINLNDESILVNEQPITDSPTENVYLSRTTNNGGNSDNAKNANISIGNIININGSGTYELSGTLSDGQVAIDSNKINGNVVIILNNVNITCKNAPAIFVYNTNNNSETCNVTISLATGSTNTIAGGKIKQSVEGWTDQANLLYYVEKGYDDDRSYYERYKYDGAISSDISLTFDGTGTLNVNSLEKEGIESKRNITINNGNYIINSLDDGINACTDGESVITINNGTVVVNVVSEAEEGDGIDSNGSIHINGGKIYAFASEKSQDSGLDAETGIYINNGYVVGTGNMADEVSESSKQAFMQIQFKDRISKDSLITILDSNKTPVVAYKANKAYSILTISTPKLQKENNYLYEGGTIEGTNENGLYTEITSYQGGTEKEFSDPTHMIERGEFRKLENNTQTKQKYEDIYFYTMLILATVLVILVILTILMVKLGKVNIKGNVVILIIGIVLGAMLTIGILYHIYPWDNDNPEQSQFEMKDRPEIQGIQNGENLPEKPEGHVNPNQSGTVPAKPQ